MRILTDTLPTDITCYKDKESIKKAKLYLTNKECKLCGKLFHSIRSTHVFCTSVCKDESRVHKLNCKGCKKEFMPSLHHKIFCSTECKTKFLINDRECYDCGKLLPSDRFSKNSYACKKCGGLRTREWYKQNRNHVLQYSKKYNQDPKNKKRRVEFDRKRRLELTDSVVRDMLQGFPKYMITHRRIELKRQQVMLYRLFGRKKKKREPTLKERKVTRKCQECGSGFIIKTRHSVLCSDECRRKQHSQLYPYETRPGGVGMKTKCNICHNEFIRTHQNQKQCSNKCVAVIKKTLGLMCNKRAKKKLTDGVVRYYLSRAGWPKEFITSELINIKREYIKLYRLIKQKNNEKFRIV